MTLYNYVMKRNQNNLYMHRLDQYLRDWTPRMALNLQCMWGVICSDVSGVGGGWQPCEALPSRPSSC